VKSTLREWAGFGFGGVLAMRWILFSGSLLPLILFGCIPYGDGHTSVHGKVVDKDGKPVRGAEVTLTLKSGGTPQSHSMTTEEDGGYGVGITHYPSTKMHFTLAVSKEGFAMHEEELTGTASYEKDIVLRKEKN
jgi:hypothetical protein